MLGHILKSTYYTSLMAFILNYDLEGVLPPLNLWSYRLYEMPQHQNEAALACPLHCICTRSRGIHICFSKVSGKSQAQKRRLRAMRIKI